MVPLPYENNYFKSIAFKMRQISYIKGMKKKNAFRKWQMTQS